MTNALTRLLDLHAEMEQRLNAQLAAVCAKEAEAQRIMSECVEERQRIERERAGLKEAAQIYREAFGIGGNAFHADNVQVSPQFAKPVIQDDTVSSLLGDAHLAYQRQVRARIGPQRFLMLEAINTMAQLSLDDMATLTKLPIRRLKDQMVSDSHAGIVNQAGDLYTLTSAGMDLLSRFKAYKRAKGQPLPTADDVHSVNARDGAETGAIQPHEEASISSASEVPASYSVDDDGRRREIAT